MTREWTEKRKALYSEFESIFNQVADTFNEARFGVQGTIAVRDITAQPEAGSARTVSEGFGSLPAPEIEMDLENHPKPGEDVVIFGWGKVKYGGGSRSWRLFMGFGRQDHDGHRLLSGVKPIEECNMEVRETFLHLHDRLLKHLEQKAAERLKRLEDLVTNPKFADLRKTQGEQP